MVTETGFFGVSMSTLVRWPFRLGGRLLTPVLRLALGCFKWAFMALLIAIPWLFFLCALVGLISTGTLGVIAVLLFLILLAVLTK